MKQTKWFIQSLVIFVLSTTALAISLFLYIYWYIRVSAGLKASSTGTISMRPSFSRPEPGCILILSILVGIILAGILIIFINKSKTFFSFFLLQHTFINNFTHELKTPVTSLKLFLETFARHELPREEQLKYIGFMIQDVELIFRSTSTAS